MKDGIVYWKITRFDQVFVGIDITYNIYIRSYDVIRPELAGQLSWSRHADVSRSEISGEPDQQPLQVEKKDNAACGFSIALAFNYLYMYYNLP